MSYLPLKSENTLVFFLFLSCAIDTQYCYFYEIIYLRMNQILLQFSYLTFFIDNFKRKVTKIVFEWNQSLITSFQK